MDNFDENIINESGLDSIIELVYLVVDGEASQSEKNLVFQHIAENENLQNEFINAIKLNKISEIDPNQNAAPKHLENNIFASLGLSFDENFGGNHTQNTIENNSDKVNITNNKSTKITKSNKNIQFAQLPIVLLFMISSWFLGYNFDNIYSYFDNKEGIKVGNYQANSDLTSYKEITKYIPKNMAKHIPITTQNNLNYQTNSQTNSQTKYQNYNRKSNEFIKNEVNTKNTNLSNANILPDKKNDNLLDEELNTLILSPIDIQSIYNLNTNLDNDNSLNKFIDDKSRSLQNKYDNFSQNLFSNIISKAKQDKKLNQKLNQNLDLNLVDLLFQSYNVVNDNVLQSKDNIDNSIIHNSYEKIVVYYNQKNDQIFNKRAEAYSIPNTSNSYEIGLMYKIEKDLHLGLQYSREYLPLYFFKNNEYERLDFQNTISALVKYSFELNDSPIQQIFVPYIQTNIGASQSGLMTTMALGADLKLIKQINLNFAVLGTNLTYFNENGVFNINKISTNIGMNFTF